MPRPPSPWRSTPFGRGVAAALRAPRPSDSASRSAPQSSDCSTTRAERWTFPTRHDCDWSSRGLQHGCDGDYCHSLRSRAWTTSRLSARASPSLRAPVSRPVRVQCSRRLFCSSRPGHPGRPSLARHPRQPTQLPAPTAPRPPPPRTSQREAPNSQPKRRTERYSARVGPSTGSTAWETSTHR